MINMKFKVKIILSIILILSVLISGGCGNNKVTIGNDSTSQTSTSNSTNGKAKTVSKWVEDKLQPGGSNEKNEQTKTWTGWFFDRDCIGINPVKHTKACNLMGSCYASGLGVIPYIEGKSFDTYTASNNFIVFDGNSSAVARAFLKSLPNSWKNNITIKVTGYEVNNIPANKDETHVPENIPAKVDHYLSGIHITKIEAAYIDGVSTNKLPSPNVVFPK